MLPTNVGCQNTGSQIQGDENSVALSAQQTFPSVANGDDNGNGDNGNGAACAECIELVLDPAQITALEAALGVSILVVCEQIVSGELTIGEVVSAAATADITATDLAALIQCLPDALGIGGGVPHL